MTHVLRPAIPDDAPAIVEIIRAGFPRETMDLFIYGAPGMVAYVRDQIELDGRDLDTSFFVAARGDTPVGFVELRHMTDRLFLNYVAVVPDARGGGVANRMLEAAVARRQLPQHLTFHLDVLDDNTAALAWYRSLGMRVEATNEWWDVAIEARGGRGGLVAGLPQALHVQQRYGFSRVTVATATASYDVGLLGTRRFRVTDPRAATDEMLAETLHRIDPARSLLLILPAGALPAGARATSLARTERMTTELPSLRARLAERVR